MSKHLLGVRELIIQNGCPNVVSILKSAKFFSKMRIVIFQTDYDADAENRSVYKVYEDHFIKYL